MWEVFRVLDEQIQSLSGLRECLVEREADACAAADRIDQRVIRLTKKYKRLLQDRTEAEEWVADVALLGVDTLREKKRENDAQMVLQTIRKEIIQLTVRVRALDEKRWLWRYREHSCEDGQYELEESIDQLKMDLERVLSEGCD